MKCYNNLHYSALHCSTNMQPNAAQWSNAVQCNYAVLLNKMLQYTALHYVAELGGWIIGSVVQCSRWISGGQNSGQLHSIQLSRYLRHIYNISAKIIMTMMMILSLKVMVRVMLISIFNTHWTVILSYLMAIASSESFLYYCNLWRPKVSNFMISRSCANINYKDS